MKRLIFVALLIGYFVNWLNVAPAHAQSKNDFSLSIDPSILEIQATSPSQPEAKLKLTNKTAGDLTMKIQLAPFRMQPNGQIQYLNPTEAKNIQSQIKDRIKIYDGQTPVTGVKLTPLESKQLDLKINVDSKFAAGDYYIALVFAGESDKKLEKSTTKSNGGIASLLLLSIGQGPVRGRIAEFSSPFFTTGPVPFKLLLGNDSNHYIIPRGRIMITDMFGKNVGRVDILPQYVLANSNRYLIDSNKAGVLSSSIIWPEKFLLGIYKAELILKLSDKGPTFTRSIFFISLPILLVFIVSVIIFILAGIILKTVRRIRNN